ncbi:ATP-dependent DNA helicase RecG [Corynebacterium sp. 13CS0277]|uniref:ATP-dependent DNA helicase RecG n=1 Tax=Corynebacterium sp. 13CS0277 TaxID=2071994 RepID=UPI000D046F51|nr:ATP-dependent DNA helicase RecG [Corynebacterium sp. 13CS0277]PRQ11208.1 ATP-dependent DNA helicase RecG [Corynebacterium sp. 13CS0277]
MLGYVNDTNLTGIIPATVATSLRKALGATTISALLEHYPRGYSHHGQGVNIDAADDGDTVTCVGEVIWAKTSYTASGKRMHRIVIADGNNQIPATFFQAKLPSRQLVPGVRAMFSGKAKSFNGDVQISHPSYVLLPGDTDTAGRGGKTRKAYANGNLRHLTAFGSPEELEELLGSLDYLPVYPARKGTTSWAILGAVDAVLHHLPPIPEPLDIPPADMVSFDDALRGIHQPDHRGPEPFITRIKYNEALSLALVMALRRADADAAHAAPNPRRRAGLRAQLLAGLPFELTAGQKDVAATIARDLARPVPMNRLLQGEVGSGKTILALLAMCQVLDSGRQAALLAPTEVLATQHAHSIRATLASAGIEARVVLLTGSLSAAARRQALLDIVSGEAQIIIGTHALIQEHVEFFDLGLAVVDEQHRFGVEQRDALRAAGPAGLTPHLLVMTATPIPRTIAMTTFGDLATSTLRELPGGRRPISTAVVPDSKPAWVARADARIAEEIDAGHQAYIVCPRIEGEGGVLALYEQLTDPQHPLSGYTVDIIHGRMSAEDKDAAMHAFATGATDILVSTTVIEVGIDVANATVMYIREADSFGVSQLHQLRGRVGRGGLPGLCLLHTTSAPDTPGYARLEAVAGTTDGFQLAEIDLRTREEGDVLGTAQSGSMKRVKLLSLVDDAALIARAAADADALVARDRALAEQLVSDVDVAAQEYIEKS